MARPFLLLSFSRRRRLVGLIVIVALAAAQLVMSAANAADIVATASTQDGTGYWATSSTGAVTANGSASKYGDMSGTSLNKPVVGIAATPTDLGYWLVASDGGIFSFGDAKFFGSTGSMTLNKPVVGMASTSTGRGYWLVATDGGIFSFGDATFYGSTGAMTLNKPVNGMAATVTGKGYWLVASDGGIFAFGDAQFYGRPNANTLGIVRTSAGYRVLLATGAPIDYFPGSTTTTTLPPNTGGSLNLPRIPWDGGPAYYSQFSKANAAGWDDPSFFPISVFLGQMQSADYYKSIGINTYQAMEHNPNVFSLSSVTNTGMFVMAQQAEWTQAEVGNNSNVVSWFISDECEMGYSDCTPDWSNDNGEYGRLAVQQSYVNKVDAYNDGRFKHANFGNGVVKTFWAPNTMDEHVALMDTASADKYSYTSPDVDDLLENSPDWPAGANPATAASYGWQVDQMRSFQSPVGSKPVWGFIETARPYLNEAGARTITPQQLEGAVWSTIIHEARGVSYFMHNNDPNCGDGSACWAANEAKLTAVNAKVKSLAPVINTQSYVYDFHNGTDTMLKTYGGSTYIFAGIGLNQSPGSKTFTLPAGVHGTTVTVVGENRTIPVVNGSFVDSFAGEYTHHVYRIGL